jgi:WS/DGAT/MGAT family acyltransferase
MRMLQRAMSTDRTKSLQLPPFWASGTPPATRSERAGPAPTVANAMAAAGQALSAQVKSVPQLIAAFGKMVRRLGDRSEGLLLPFDAPQSMLNGRVREKRRFATQQFSLERLRTLAKAGGGTLNDVVLAISGGALRRFLHERGGLPDKTLTAGIPVSVRPLDDEGTGNAISFIIATLGTDIADAKDRFEAIKASVRHAKDHVQSLPRQAMTQYTVLLMAPTILTLLTGIGGRTRPMFNVTISNVPGPDKPLYFRGAELLAIYPVSIVTHGQAVNITCQSYAGSMNFGFTGCHSSLPSLQRMAVYAADALQELEAALLPPVAKPGRGKPAKPDMTAGTKPKPRATRTRATQAAAVEPVAAPATAPAPAPAPATKAPRKRAAARTREAG